MSIAAQQLDRRIVLQRFAVVGKNEFNEDIEDWAELATVWARRRDASDSQKIEFMAAGQTGSFIVSRFTIRSSLVTRSVTPVDRIIHDGKVWDIKGVKEADEGRHRFLEITASRDAD
jgi:SPP1 family predicted phage head-tail adaptor